MGISGPAPKDPAQRARRNKDPHQKTILRFERAEAPELPPELAANYHVFQWWDTWVGSPQAEHFGRTDWMFLLETAFLVDRFYSGDFAVAAELRMRQAKFGATPEDRAKLRMVFADADDKDQGAGAPQKDATVHPYGKLRAVDTEGPEPDDT